MSEQAHEELKRFRRDKAIKAGIKAIINDDKLDLGTEKYAPEIIEGVLRALCRRVFEWTE